VDLEVLPRLTDRGTQALVRGCKGSLTSLRVGGCTQLSSVTTSLIADHCPGIRRLGVGGLANITDIELEVCGRRKRANGGGGVVGLWFGMPTLPLQTRAPSTLQMCACDANLLTDKPLFRSSPRVVAGRGPLHAARVARADGVPAR
jgi:hypothetical protein